MNSQSSYRQVLKATSIFGGVQVINILTLMLRGKFVALLLGPVGMGISGLLVSTITLVGSISSLGLNHSAVRDISIASGTNDINKLSTIIVIFRKWLWLSCLIGVIIVIGASPLLSTFTFGNTEYIWSFIGLSLFLVLNTLNNGNIAILEGTRSMKSTAKSSMIGSVLGLLTSLPLYYFFGIKGIVPSLILGALTTYCIGSFYVNKIDTIKVNVSKATTFARGGEMAKLGFAMVASTLLGSLVIYLINAYVRSRGGVTDVGLYQAAITITNQSIGLVFSAMTIDYYPKLAAIHEDRKQVNTVVNQQAIITILVSSPILIALIVFSPITIKLLLSNDFSQIINVVRWLAVGNLFTAPMVVIGFIPLAKGDKKRFFLYGSLINNILALFFLSVGYTLDGLVGMSIGYFLSQLLYIIFISLKFSKIYSLSYDKQFLKIYFLYIILCAFALVVCLVAEPTMSYILGILILLLAGSISIYKLEKYTAIFSALKEKLKIN